MKHDDESKIKTSIFAVVKHEDGTTDIHEGHNLITTAGKVYYAKMSAGESPGGGVTDPDFTSATNTALTWTDGTAAIAAGNEFDDISSDIIVDGAAANATAIVSTNYPKTNDTDPLNPGTTGTDTVTYKFEFDSGTNTNFAESGVDVVIHHKDATGATHVLLCHAEVDSGGVAKSTSDSLTVYVNHQVT